MLYVIIEWSKVNFQIALEEEDAVKILLLYANSAEQALHQKELYEVFITAFLDFIHEKNLKENIYSNN